MAHISCITVCLVCCLRLTVSYSHSVQRLPDLLPQPPWYCKQCFPEASHIYYPGSLKPLYVDVVVTIRAVTLTANWLWQGLQRKWDV